MKIIKLALMLFCTSILLSAQSTTQPTWALLTSEAQGTNMTLPPGTIWRMGNVTDNKWSASQTVSGTGPLIISTYYPDMGNPFPDPDQGQPKVIQIQETASVQKITVGTQVISVPALSAGGTPPPGTTPPVTTPSPTFAVVLKGTTYQCTNIALSNSGVLTLTCN